MSVIISFKDGVVIELHDNMSFDVIECSEVDTDFNFHFAMSLSTQANFIDDVSEHEKVIFNKINNRLGGVLTP